MIKTKIVLHLCGETIRGVAKYWLFSQPRSQGSLLPAKNKATWVFPMLRTVKPFFFDSLRSRRLEVVGTRKKRAREKETRVSPSVDLC